AVEVAAFLGERPHAAVGGRVLHEVLVAAEAVVAALDPDRVDAVRGVRAALQPHLVLLAVDVHVDLCGPIVVAPVSGEVLVASVVGIGAAVTSTSGTSAGVAPSTPAGGFFHGRDEVPGVPVGARE